MPKWNGPVITLAMIIKFVMSSASKAGLEALFIASREIKMINTLEEKSWPHSNSPIQTDNSSSEGVVINTMFPRKIKTMDRRIHWMRCRES